MADPDYRALCARMADELDHYRQLLMDPRREAHALATEARALLDQPEPKGATAKELRQIFDDQSGYIGDEQVMWSSDFVAAARALLARWGCPTPQPLADSEAAELAAELRHFVAGYQQMRGLDPEHVYSIHRGDAMEAHLRISRLSRIAELLEGPTPQPPADGEVAELVEGLKLISDGMSAIGHESDSWFVARAADLLQRQHSQPVAVSERPWEREGWCDEQGRCWIFMPDIGTDPSWRLTDPRDVGPYHTHSLPANALPTPETSQ